MLAWSWAMTVSKSVMRSRCSWGTSSPVQAGAYQRSSSSVVVALVGHMHRKVNAPVSMGTTRLGKMPKEVDVCRQRRGTAGLSCSSETMAKSRNMSCFSTVSRLCPWGSMVTVTDWSL